MPMLDHYVVLTDSRGTQYAIVEGVDSWDPDFHMSEDLTDAFGFADIEDAMTVATAVMIETETPAPIVSVIVTQTAP